MKHLQITKIAKPNMNDIFCSVKNLRVLQVVNMTDTTSRKCQLKKNLLFNSPSTFDAYFWSVYQGRHIKTIWHSHWVSVVSWLAYTQKKTLSYTYQEIPVIHGLKFWYRLRIFYCCYFPLLKITLYGTKWKRSNQTKTKYRIKQLSDCVNTIFYCYLDVWVYMIW